MDGVALKSIGKCHLKDGFVKSGSNLDKVRVNNVRTEKIIAKWHISTVSTVVNLICYWILNLMKFHLT